MLEFFITATDTDAGKTFVACALANALGKAHKKVAVFKPIAAGCDPINFPHSNEYERENSEQQNSFNQNNVRELVNQDTQLLAKYSHCQQTFSDITPILFEQAIAPHIAASSEGKNISLNVIINAFQKIKTLNADVTLIEGAGGWRLPLGNGLFLSEFVKKQNIPVILVVNMKLGCLNHALLTYEAIKNDGLPCQGWVANSQAEMPYLRENIDTLKSLLPMPLLATISANISIEQASSCFDLGLLF